MNAVVSRVSEDEKSEKKMDDFDRLREDRAERYAMQSVAKDLLPNERVKICLRNIVSSYVEVRKHLITEKAFYSGLMICGSVWTCPVCAAKISERRKNELHQATTAHKSEGGYLAMLTLTVRHSKSDKLGTLLEAFNGATNKMMTSKQYHQIRQDMAS